MLIRACNVWNKMNDIMPSVYIAYVSLCRSHFSSFDELIASQAVVWYIGLPSKRHVDSQDVCGYKLPFRCPRYHTVGMWIPKSVLWLWSIQSIAFEGPSNHRCKKR